MKPWREIAIPHADVLKGTFQQSEFAADISAVHSGKAPKEYQDASAFFERTFITEGMRLLLTQVAQRLSGKGGEPVVQLQTAFGGGKTHTMLAVLHLATRKVPLSELAGIPTLVEKAGLMDIPQARVAVLDGTALSPGQPWKRERTTIKTLWGELAWQLGGSDGFKRVKEADANGTSPGKETLRELLEAYAPCVVLMDEMVAYIRQFVDQPSLISGGTFASNISFIQSLTEAAKLVPTAILLASLPESDPKKDQRSVQIGGEQGFRALCELENVVGRVQALWKPVGTEEAFEIVRRRLFEPIQDLKARDVVCRAFADTYASEGGKLPSETHEGRYYDRLCQAYPIHPELFDRLYEDWTTIEGFQRTRGVLKLMAKVIHKLWQNDNKDLMILPGSIPLFAADVRNEMMAPLGQGWDPVIEADIDGDRAETTELEAKEPRFGQVNAARRVARTLFLGTAPASVGTKPGTRGLDRGRILLGCLQPGQTSALYSDALNRLADRTHYLNSTGDKASETTRFWFDTRANLRREMEDRKPRFHETTDVRKRIEDEVKKLFANSQPFDGVHVFTPHADVPDDSALRLVILPPEHGYLRDMPRHAEDAVHAYLRTHGNQPRQRSNRLLFLSADQLVLNRLKDATRVALAWASIVEDATEGRLNIDQNQHAQAKKEANASREVLPRVARECFRWLLCPVLDEPTATAPSIEAHSLNTSSGTAPSELKRICSENELVIETWSPIHLRQKLRDFYWKADKPAVVAKTFWEDSLRYLYLPRLKSRDVLATVIRTGSQSREFFGTALGIAGDKYEGFELGTGKAQFDDTLLLIEPGVAEQYEREQQKQNATKTLEATPTEESSPNHAQPEPGNTGTPTFGTATVGTTKQNKRFVGMVEVSPTISKSALNKIAEDIINLLTKDPTAKIQVTLEISAEFPSGASADMKRSVSENANTLGFKTKEWE